MYDFRNESRRLKGWDYSNPGIYFVTICTDADMHWFGKIKNNNLILSDLGTIAHKFWTEIRNHHNNVQISSFIIMPNHVRGIVLLRGQSIYKINKTSSVPYRNFARNLHLHRDSNENNNKVQQKNSKPTNEILVQRTNTKDKKLSRLSPKSGSLSVIIRSYKSAVTRYANKNGYSDFKSQPRFYDRIIRNEKELYSIQKYIENNPMKWIENNR